MYSEVSEMNTKKAGGSALAEFLKQRQGFTNRIIDIIGSVLGIILLFPLFAFIAILIKRDSPGPIHYWGPRMGRGGKPFKIWLFVGHAEIRSLADVQAAIKHRRPPCGNIIRNCLGNHPHQ